MKQLEFDNYDEYLKTQIKVNKEKLNNVWVTDSEIKRTCDHIKINIDNPSFGICHGVRNGYEVNKFREYLNIDVVGTDISPTANDFDNVIQWDFHYTKFDWIGKADFVYSNSWDHSFNPNLAFQTWLRSLKGNGLCYIHWSPHHGDDSVKNADCFGCSFNELLELLDKISDVKSIIRCDGTNIIVIGKK